MDGIRSLPNDLLNKTKKPKKVESKSLSDSSCSDSFNTSSKKNWKLAISQNGDLFYGKRSKKSQSQLPWAQSPKMDSFKLAAVKNSDINKELYLIVSSLDRYRFGRRSSIIESMLGFGVIPFSDNIECLMITNIIDSSLKLEFPYLQEGDWFKSMDNIEVRTENIDKLLLQYTRATKVRLTFKGSYTKQKETDDKIELRELNNFKDFADTLRNSLQKEPKLSSPDDHIFLTLIINREYFKGENNECLFYYPFSSNNFLYKAKGSFLTLDSVINMDLRSKALQSTITVLGTKYYIDYGHVNDALVVCAFSSFFQTKMSAKSNSNDFINFLKFNVPEYQTLQARQYLADVCHVFKSNIYHDIDKSCFAAYTSSSLGIALPKEAQLRICDALSEFESMDHKRWNEPHKNSSDLTVCGTALYYNKFLLSSNLPIDLRIPIECSLRVKGITSAFTFQNIKEMYIWEELHNFDNESKHYLAICIRHDLMLVTVLRGPLIPGSDTTCISYMEEITNTIEYLLSSGIDSISQFWLDSGKRPSLKKTNSHMPRKFKFTIQKDISIDNSESNTTTPHHESPPHSLLTSEDGFKKSCDSESASDWQTMNFNDFKEFNKDQEYVEPLLNEVKNIMPLNWSAGWSNDLKFFLHLNSSDAIILKPLKPQCSQLHLDVIRNCILHIHDVIHCNSISKKKQRDPNANWNRNTVLKEHSLSMNLVNSLGEKDTLFIVGRLFSFPMKEIYVCFGQNISQNLVELSFRMSLLNLG